MGCESSVFREAQGVEEKHGAALGAAMSWLWEGAWRQRRKRPRYYERNSKEDNAGKRWAAVTKRLRYYEKNGNGGERGKELYGKDEKATVPREERQWE